MKILVANAYGRNAAFGVAWHEAWLDRLRATGIDLVSFYSALPVPGNRALFPVLDRLWRTGDRGLMTMYERLAEAAAGCDVLVNYGGVNLHPGFLEQLPTINVLGFYDDPESSEHVSRPVAAAHHLCMVGNVAMLDTYREWGAREVEWWPIGFRDEDYDPSLTREAILEGERDVDVALMCERVTPFRRARVDRFALAFPQGVYRGPGWPQGFLPEAERVPLLQRTRVGINMHNSTGPINFRTFYLPANGVLQVCDNRSHLGRVFELGKEVAGYETIDEAIDLTRYYLAHERERRELAAAGWERALRDYNEVAAFRVMMDAVEARWPARAALDEPAAVRVRLEGHRRATRPRRLLHAAAAPVMWPARQLRRIAVGGTRRLHRWGANALYLSQRALRQLAPGEPRTGGGQG